MDHLKACAYLPKTQIRALQFKVHISYFLQKCKKSKPLKKSLPLWYSKTQCLKNY